MSFSPSGKTEHINFRSVMLQLDQDAGRIYQGGRIVPHRNWFSLGYSTSFSSYVASQEEYSAHIARTTAMVKDGDCCLSWSLYVWIVIIQVLRGWSTNVGCIRRWSRRSVLFGLSTMKNYSTLSIGGSGSGKVSSW